ncbi:MAG: S1C family serine protease [Chloroflexaceae bacterium]|jgi:S1-C subfamily serine protease|nr:S1C family serine protease [Chloroflexaceae bacterium]
MTEQTNPLANFSNQMADAVERASLGLVMVNGRVRQSASGVVYGPDMVLTADHVLEREDDLSIQTHDGRTLPAQFAGRDPASDLALLRVAGLNLSPLSQAEGKARVGQFVLAVGRPSANGPMASVGIVSAVGGPLRTRRGGMLEQYIQTDATPYPGFSGGPLIDPSGTALGLLTTGLVNGVALAVPMEIAWRVAATLAQHGSVKRGYLGISSQPVELPEGQRAGRSQERGLLIVRVEPGSPAEKGGLLLGDILVGLDGQPVDDTDALQSMLIGNRVGASVNIEVIRGGGLYSVQVVVGVRN